MSGCALVAQQKMMVKAKNDERSKVLDFQALVDPK